MLDTFLPRLIANRIGKAVIDLGGQKPGTASQVKLLGNVLILNMIESVAEAHVLAEKSGLEADYLHQVIENIWGGPYAIYSNRMRSGAYCKEKVAILLRFTR